MPTRDGYPAGTPCWADLATTDVEAAKKFYAEIFGWEYDEPETDSTPYTMAAKNGLSAAGIGPVQSPGQPTAWSMYIAVDDADAAVEKIRAAGGSVIMECIDVMDAGRMAFASDVTGAAFGVWQAKRHFGAAIVNEHGALNWTELLTDDVEKAMGFYAEVFGWTYETSQMPSGPYTAFSVGERAVGGALKKPMAEIPNYWSVYFAVDDIAAAVETATANGASVDYATMEIPDVGAFSGLADPTGGHFTVIQLASEVD